MLYNVPKTFNGPDLQFHKYQTMAELNALNQARRTRVFPTVRKINPTIRLKNGQTLTPRGLSGPVRLNYNRKSSPYLSGNRLSRRAGLSGITDFFSGIKDTITGTVGAVTGTVTGVANAAQPLEQLLQNNPSLVNLVKTFVPTAQNPTPVTVVAKPTTITTGQTLGVSNKVWVIGAAGAGALALIKILGRR